MAEGREAGCGGVPNLEKSRIEVQALKLPEGNVPLPPRLCLGRLSEARNQRLHFIDSVRHEERIDKIRKDVQCNGGVILVLTQRRRCERVAQQIHPILGTILCHRPVSEPKTRLAFNREESVGCSDIARSLQVPKCFLDLAGNAKVPGSVAHSFTLVPEALHFAQDLDAPVLQPDDRERVVCPARRSTCDCVCPCENFKGGIAGCI
jgi:hypothetical protein